MSERPEEQLESPAVDDSQASDVPAARDDAAAADQASPAGDTPRDDAQQDDAQQADAQQDETPADALDQVPSEPASDADSLPESPPAVAETPDTESAPERPEAEYSSTVADSSLAESPADDSAGDSATAGEQQPEPAASEQQTEPAAKRSAPRKKKGKVQPLEEIPAEELEEQEVLDRDWYILKVQSNREKSIRDALERRVKVAGLERFFGDIIVPTEDVAEYKNGKRRVTKRKLWPGYIVVNMAINDDTWFLVRETPGIGDFTGSIGKPTPMLPHEVDRIRPKAEVETDDAQPIKIGIRFKQGDRVRVKDGYFQNFEGDVEAIDEANGRVTVMISIFGRSTPVELEHWQIEDI